MPRAVFKLHVLAGESFIQIKQLNCEVIMWKQLQMVVNKLFGIASRNHIKEKMFEQVLHSTTVSLDMMVAPAVEERRVLWTTYDNLHMWFMSFKKFLPHYGFAPTSATAAEQEKMWFNFFLHTKKTCGKFGHNEVQEWPCVIGMNKKDGMSNKEFNCYIKNTIMLLFLYVEDKQQTWSQLHGPAVQGTLSRPLYLSGLPNTTSVQQETDRNYGLFKSTM